MFTNVCAIWVKFDKYMHKHVLSGSSGNMDENAAFLSNLVLATLHLLSWVCVCFCGLCFRFIGIKHNISAVASKCIELIEID